MVELLHRLGGKDRLNCCAEEGRLAARVEHLRQCAVGKDDAPLRIERGDAVGDGLEHRLQLAAARFQRCVGFGQLRVGGFDGAAAVLKVGGHVVEAADEFAEFLGCAVGDAMGVVSGGDRFHCVGQRFHRLRHLLGQMQREPGGGEEREAGQHEEQQHVEIADLTALAIGVPVTVDRGLKAGHGRGHAVGHGHAHDYRSALFDRCGAEGVVDITGGEDGEIRALGRGKNRSVKVTSCMRRWSGRLGDRRGIFVGGSAFRQPRFDLWRRGGLRHVERGDRVAFAIDNRKAPLQCSLMLRQNAILGCRLAGAHNRRIRNLCRDRDACGQSRGDRLGFRTGVGRGVLRQFEREPVRIVPHLIWILGEPALDRPVHQVVAEEIHERDRDQGDQHRPPQHPRPQARAQNPAPLVCVKLQHVPHQQDQHRHEHDEHQNGEADKDDNLSDSGGVQELETKGVHRCVHAKEYQQQWSPGR